MNLEEQVKSLWDTELEQFILQRLKRRNSLNQITTLVCEMSSCDWDVGERLVLQVQSKHKDELDRQTHRHSIPIGIMLIIMGTIIVFLVSLWVKQSVDLFGLIQDRVQAGEPIGVQTAWHLLNLFSPHTPRILYWAALLLLIGLGMILGGVVGILQAVWQLWRFRNSP